MLCVAHGAVIHQLYRQASGGSHYTHPIRNGSVGHLRIQGSKWLLVDWNDMSWLGDKGGAEGTNSVLLGGGNFGGSSCEA